ncbi:succinyl-CoA synthetase, beta subunit [Pyrolobus fumarii 1A]|uniref:Succinate--CoA ligase [ADP-forming] subunit beta n=1 Tax=Pyrolobus fumarii (strain DSM 11204 / 1A) TaxID=694429 RepID=G0EFX7_PYRF1|nr:ADP-forming succinate--CoA ligase subunit beta [Pyrolobus fumarii]AEM39078.1 succinyl-CoA synthetase, beta subunit [Pyrolobus fumarii 1A]
MNIVEFEAKRIAREYGIPIPEGRLATRPEEVIDAIHHLGLPVVIKAQVPVAGRGKAGGVKLAKSEDEAYEIALKMLGSEIKGYPVYSVLVEEAVPHKQELYLSFIVNRSNRTITMLASSEGGMEIEEIAAKKPWAIKRLDIDPFVGLKGYQVRKIAKNIGLSGQLLRQFEEIAKAMYKMLIEYDAELVESNPLAITEDGRIVALDFRMVVDDNAVYRHPEFEKLREYELRGLERIAHFYGLAYVELDGDIGVIGNGAGLTMATLDMIYHYGGRPANFLDIGGGARRDKVKRAVTLLLRHPKVKVILVNVFGGITRVDEVAHGIVAAYEESGVRKPLVARLVGTMEEEGRRILEEKGFKVYQRMDEAVREAVRLAKEAGGEA